MPTDPAARWHTAQWLMFQMGGPPLFGQLGFFHKFGGKDYEDKLRHSTLQELPS